MSWFRKRKHQFRGVLAFLHPQFLHYSQLAVVLEAHCFPTGKIRIWFSARTWCASRTAAGAMRLTAITALPQDNHMVVAS